MIAKPVQKCAGFFICSEDHHNVGKHLTNSTLPTIPLFD